MFASDFGRPVGDVDQDELARVYAMIENIDQNVGRLVDFLDETELARDTLLVFLCDNGAQGRRFSRGLRGSKGQVYEGGSVARSLFVGRRRLKQVRLGKISVPTLISSQLCLRPAVSRSLRDFRSMVTASFPC